MNQLHELKQIAGKRPGRARQTATTPSSSTLSERPISVPATRPRVTDPASAWSISASGLAHDSRNLLAAVNLYCDLLAEPGVLGPGFEHYADDLRHVGQAGARLMGKLAAAATPTTRANPPEAKPEMVTDLGREVYTSRNLLATIAGPEIQLDVECLPCAGKIPLSCDDLLRILVNLVRNATEALAEACPAEDFRGRIRITAQRGDGANFCAAVSDAAPTVVLSVQDNGPGIPAEVRPRIFEAGFSTKCSARTPYSQYRGLGLAIVWTLVEEAAGELRVISPGGRGTRVEIELPLVSEAGKTLVEPMLSPARDAPPFSAHFEKERRVQC